MNDPLVEDSELLWPDSVDVESAFASVFAAVFDDPFDEETFLLPVVVMSCSLVFTRVLLLN